MELIFLTSGSGSTARYITDNISDRIHEGRKISIRGYIYENHPVMKDHINHYKTKAFFANALCNVFHNGFNYKQVSRSDYSSNELFHGNIWESILQWWENQITIDIPLINTAAYATRIIVLAGWMHIVPDSFIQNCNRNGIQIINLHPTLQYQLIGRDVYPKIWKMYKEGMITETGCMVHYVSRKLDRGDIIHESRLNLRTMESFETYHLAMYGNGTDIPGIEKTCLLEAIRILYDRMIKATKEMETCEITPYSFPLLNGFTLKHRGKVRDIYESRYYPDYLFVITSDRISANDIVISHLPGKGAALNKINTFWHNLFGIGQMVCTTDANLMVIRKMRTIPLEIIVRRRITGSLWKMYSQEGIREINGYKLPDDMREGDIFPSPIITPTTKGTHDYPITFAEIVEMGILNRGEIETIRSKSISLFQMAERYLEGINVEMIDTKFEFGFTADGSIEFIDEVFTPDSSRFIVSGKRMDKDILRRWARDNEIEILSHPPGKDGCRGVKLPNDVRKQLMMNYQDFLERLQSTGGRFHCANLSPSHLDSGDSGDCEDGDCEDGDTPDVRDDNHNQEMMVAPIVQLQSALTRLSRVAIILAGSKSDVSHVEKIRAELRAKDILAFVYYSSAHKNTETVLQILQAFESRSQSKIIYITVAGMSNALSGVVAANVSRPVIACPPFADKGDYQVNIHSTLQMPSGVPTATILRPDNVAGFVARLFAL